MGWASFRVVNIATNNIGDTFWVLVQVSAILFVCKIDIGIGDTVSHIFLVIFNTNTVVIRCTSSVCQQQHYCSWKCKSL